MTDHRAIAVGLFNRVWELMEKTDRTPAETDEMIHGAHASRYHWGIAGTPENWERGEWQVSRVYAVLGRAEPCRKHAERCLEICMEHGIGSWDLSFAFEALARAASVAGDFDEAKAFAEKAYEASKAIEEKEDLEHFHEAMETIRGIR